MSMNSPHESVKDLVGEVWKNNRPLAIAVMVIAVVVGYILYKKSQATVVAPAAAITSANGIPGGNTIYNSYSSVTKTVTGQTVAAPPPVVSLTHVATIRGKQTTGIDKGWDSTHTGVPVRAQPSGAAQVVSTLPFGSTIQLLQSALTAAPNQNGGSSQWYPVAGGYLSAWDIASIK